MNEKSNVAEKMSQGSMAAFRVEAAVKRALRLAEKGDHEEAFSSAVYAGRFGEAMPAEIAAIPALRKGFERGQTLSPFDPVSLEVMHERKPPEPSVQAVGEQAPLHWSDFLDAPVFGAEHPDYPAAVALLNKVEAWLKMDRKQLIEALIKLHSDAADVTPTLSALEAAGAVAAKPSAQPFSDKSINL